ncbi:MAG: tRNA 2-thiouridine(34) synthase MnmA [Bdellovibrionales bacterium]|nr:tRNA 2-thiouridine(34) synthase MnmA [Bdellovibrionales bacterium]
MEKEDLTGKVVVAMSGGVDSSVAALLLSEAGFDCVGVSMQVWDYRNHGGCSNRATCCAPSDFADARSVANDIGIPYYVFDFEEKFHDKVIARFLDTYAGGETPNPCVDCNNDVKFRELRNRAVTLGCRSVATGHYVKLESRPDGFHVFRGKDDKKDQSYFLYGLKQDELSKTLFPLGELSKVEVREIAKAAGIKTADKPESQDICFVSGTIDDFVGERLGTRRKPGAFRLKDGQKVGEHDGIHRFTVGQRKGLGLSGYDAPLYVLEIDPVKGDVYVGYKSELEVPGFEVRELNWVHPALVGGGPAEEMLVHVQVRHKHRGVPAKVFVRDGVANVSFVDEWTSPAPGQAAVFYDPENRELLGGGRIVGKSGRPQSLKLFEAA